MPRKWVIYVEDSFWRTHVEFQRILRVPQIPKANSTYFDIDLEGVHVDCVKDVILFGMYANACFTQRSAFSYVCLLV